MSTSNPSYLLISRNPRSLARPQLAPTSPPRHSPDPPQHLFSTLTHPHPADSDNPSAAAAGQPSRHRRARSTPSLRSARGRRGDTGDGSGGGSGEGKDGEEGEDHEEEEDEVVVHPTFMRDAALPGRVKVVVGKNEFWCHKEVLWFASPFFQALLQGNWAETATASLPQDQDTEQGLTVRPTQPGRPESILDSSAVTDTMSTDDADDKAEADAEADETESDPAHSQKASIYLDADDEQPALDAPVPLGIQSSLLDSTSTRLGVELAGLTVGNDGAAGSLTGSQSPLSLGRVGATLDQVASPSEPDLSHHPHSTGSSTQPHLRGQTSTSSPLPSLPPATEPISSPSLPAFLLPQTSVPLPPAVTPHSAGRRSGRGSSVSVFERKRPAPSVLRRQRDERDGAVDAVVELHEESPGAFQDFLFWAYPHLECKVTWTNVEGLLALSSKLIVPALQKLCEHFLMTHASGRPVVALSLAEEHDNAELYREASRFVLDQATWDKDEMDSLSGQTRLKLAMRRTWFLERLLKLGSIDVKKEYTCRIDCPEPTRCQIQLDEKWRQAHSAVCRYGPPQPSVAFRCLRQLETFPTNPSLVMPHPLCQIAAKSWVMTLFDRMFQPKMLIGTPGTEKYWLYITMD